MLKCYFSLCRLTKLVAALVFLFSSSHIASYLFDRWLLRRRNTARLITLIQKQLYKSRDFSKTFEFRQYMLVVYTCQVLPSTLHTWYTVAIALLSAITTYVIYWYRYFRFYSLFTIKKINVVIIFSSLLYTGRKKQKMGTIY